MANRTQLLQMRAPANLLPMMRKGGGVVRRYHTFAGLGDVDSAAADLTLKTALLGTPASFAIAYLDRTGKVAKIDQFASKTAMGTAWDAMVDGSTIPSAIQEIVWVDKTDPDFNGQVSGGGWNIAVNPQSIISKFTKINWKSAAPWIIGGAIVIGAIYYSSKKKSPARRRRASWRRRTLTVWR